MIAFYFTSRRTPAILIMVTTHGYGALGDRALPREYIILHCFQGRAGSPSTPLQRRFAIIRIAEDRALASGLWQTYLLFSRSFRKTLFDRT